MVGSCVESLEMDMNSFRRGFGPRDGLGLSHDLFDVNAGVTTSHLRSAIEEKVAMRLASAVKPVVPPKPSGDKKTKS